MSKKPENPPQSNPLTFEGSDNPRTILLGLAYWDRDDQGKYRVRFLWKRLLIALAVMAVAGWLALSSTAWWFVTHKRQVPDVSFFDIALPHRWSEYQRKRGDAYIDQAKAALEEQRYREALQMLRVGVAKSPANLEGRLELARFYQAIRRIDHAVTVMDTGLPYAGKNPEFLGSYIQMLLQHHMDDDVVALADKHLADPELGPRHAQLLAMGAATANFLRGDYDAATSLLARPDLANAADARLLQAKIEWQQGHDEIALMRIRTLINEHSTAEEPYAVLMELLEELGRTDEVARVAVERSIAFPDSAQARRALLQAYADTGNEVRLAREVESVLREASENEQMFFALAEYAVTAGDAELGEKLRGIADKANLQPGLGTLIALEAKVAAREYQTALDEIEVLRREEPEWLGMHLVSLSGLQAVAEYGIGDLTTAEPLLGEFIHQSRGNPRGLLAVTDQLLRVGAIDASRRTLEAAVMADERNEATLAKLIEFDIETDTIPDLPEYTDRLLSMRKTPLELLEKIHRALGSDRFLFSEDRYVALENIKQTITRHEQQERIRREGT